MQAPDSTQLSTGKGLNAFARDLPSLLVFRLISGLEITADAPVAGQMKAAPTDS